MKISQLQEGSVASMPSASQAAPEFGRNKDMLESDVGSTVAGDVPSVPVTNGSMQRRGKGSMFAGISTSEKFANSRKAGIKESSIDDNFTAGDINKLATIRDLATIKAQAKELIKGKPMRRMKPEKIAYFYDKVDSLTSPMKVVKLMYDLLLAGEGLKTVGSANSMDSNSYQKRFTEEEQLDEVDPRNFDSDEDYYAARNAPAKARSSSRSSPGVNQDDEAYFREIFRKKRLAAQQQERDADHNRLATGTNEGEMEEGQKWPDSSNSLAKRSAVVTDLKGAPSKAGRGSGMTVATRIEPSITSTKVQRKDDRPIPSFLQKGVAEGHDSEDLANEVYAEFERIYPNLARRVHERTIHAAIMDVLNYGGDNDPGALAQDVARAVKQQMQQGVAEGLEDKIKQLKQDYATAVHWSKNDTNPHKREAARQKAEKIKAHLEKQYKQGVSEESKGLWANIHAKRERIKNGSSERMRKPGSKGSPTASALKKSATEGVEEGRSQKYKSSINCSHPKGFSQKAHCAGKKKHNESVESVMEMTCPDCGMCQSHGSLNEIKKGQKDSNGFTSCWSGYHAAGTKKSATTGKQVRNCVPNESVAEGEQRMSRAAKGNEKYGKDGMQALAKAGRDGASEKKMDAIRDKHDNYNESIEEEFNPEYDDEAGMAETNLHTIARSAQGLIDVIGQNENLPEWCQEKIAKVEGMLVAVWDYLESQEEQGINPQMDEDWQKANKSDKTSGMSRKAVKAYRRENPGSKLKTAVTTKPSKLKPGSKAAKRRKSFCARMSGNKGPMKKPNGKLTPKALALRRWNCESVEQLEELAMIAEQKVAEARNRVQQAVTEAEVSEDKIANDLYKDFQIFKKGADKDIGGKAKDKGISSKARDNEIQKKK